MKRREPLPENLSPWFVLGDDGAVRCRRCAAVFVGQHAGDLELAKHVTTHIGAPLQRAAAAAVPR